MCHTKATQTPAKWRSSTIVSGIESTLKEKLTRVWMKIEHDFYSFERKSNPSLEGKKD